MSLYHWCCCDFVFIAVIIIAYLLLFLLWHYYFDFWHLYLSSGLLSVEGLANHDKQNLGAYLDLHNHKQIDGNPVCVWTRVRTFG